MNSEEMSGLIPDVSFFNDHVDYLINKLTIFGIFIDKTFNVSFKNSITSIYFESVKKIVLFFMFLMISLISSWSQNVRVSGFISESGSKERLINATIFETYSKSGSISDKYGFYSLLLPSGPVHLTFTFIGYKPAIIEKTLSRDTVINVFLEVSTEQIDEVVVSEERL
mgnify:CR=1 FL=1